MAEAWTIRRATVADAAAISDLVSTVARQHIVPDCSTEGGEQLLASMTAAAIAGKLRGDHVYCVAEQLRAGEPVIIGVAGIRPPGHLYQLFVAGSMQGQGIARALWRHARDAFFAAHGPSAVTVNAARHAVDVYRHLGFTALDGERVRDGVPSTPMLWRHAPQA